MILLLYDCYCYKLIINNDMITMLKVMKEIQNMQYRHIIQIGEVRGIYVMCYSYNYYILLDLQIVC